VSAAHRFFVDATVLRGDRATIEGDQARQMAGVLRLARGEEVVLVVDGEDLRTRLDRVSERVVEGTVVARGPSAGEPRIRLTLALPLLRGDRSEEVVEAVTQLGVSRIVPFTSERSVARELSAAKLSRWRTIARESAETARRGRVPDIAPALGWPELFDALGPPVVVAWEGETGAHLRYVTPRDVAILSLVIGPEGGLAADEVALARSRGAVTASLGPRNLRSETAAIAAVAQVFVLLE
jgi:16S rRNA (uracil1498-N3)-methyltransferase